MIFKRGNCFTSLSLTPNANFYFDYQQDKNSLSGVYNYNPMLESLNDAQKALILGIQANLWCEMDIFIRKKRNDFAINILTKFKSRVFTRTNRRRKSRSPPCLSIEIKKYPLLTEKGAWRTFNNHDRECMRLAKEQDNPDYEIPAEKLRITQGDTLYGGFYTQQDIKEIALLLSSARYLSFASGNPDISSSSFFLLHRLPDGYIYKEKAE